MVFPSEFHSRDVGSVVPAVHGEAVHQMAIETSRDLEALEGSEKDGWVHEIS